MSRRVLFVTPEIAPLNKVGGLGDVSLGLLQALRREGWDARVLVPGYPDVKAACDGLTPLASLIDHQGREGCLLEALAPALDLPLYLADFPHHFRDPGSPYGRLDSDQAEAASRFLAFAGAAARLALGAAERWRPEVVHANDWTTGLVPALLRHEVQRPATVFTIHNLAHQGLFPRSVFEALELPWDLWTMDGLEFYGQMSFIKGGLVYADRINTVSPTYAREIVTAPSGCGLEGLLQLRQSRLSGILNGVDYDIWDPGADGRLPCRFRADDLTGKAQCKAELQAETRLKPNSQTPLVGIVSRLTHQKGIDLIAEAGERLLHLGIQLVCLGSGDPHLESAMTRLAAAHPERCAVRIGYDEGLAHRIIAGSDMFLMPSRFEPCGLTQMYSLRYGTVPVAARTGGLEDTVVDVDPDSLTAHRANGFLFEPDAAPPMLTAVARAVEHFRGSHWARLQRAGMGADFGWGRSARRYGELYEYAIADCAGRPMPLGPGTGSH